jgi:large subunit ribosomal protein L19
MEALIDFVQNEFISQNEFPDFSSGDTITVYYQIREGEKIRTQFFKGVVIQIKGKGKSKTFTIRKMSGTVGVERIFPINLPTIEKIEINKLGKVRRSRIYYFKNLRGKKSTYKRSCKVIILKPLFSGFFIGDCNVLNFENAMLLYIYNLK